jgi:hypothetical protein
MRLASADVAPTAATIDSMRTETTTAASGRLLNGWWLADTELFSDGLDGGGPGASHSPRYAIR